MIRALIFDFDGLILETEEPIFLSWQELFAEYGCLLKFEDWATIIGTQDGNFHPKTALEKCLNKTLPESVLQRRLDREMQLILARPVLPGVEKYLRDARSLGLKIGLASSSSCDWVTGHLTRLDLADYFDVIRAGDDVKLTKPAPELYRAALLGLGVGAVEAVALEDSPNGITAAKAAGMFCVAVPNAMTRSLPLQHADLRLNSLADISLSALLERVESQLARGAAMLPGRSLPD